jgi:hypothetical protein
VLSEARKASLTARLSSTSMPHLRRAAQKLTLPWKLKFQHETQPCLAPIDIITQGEGLQRPFKPIALEKTRWRSRLEVVIVLERLVCKEATSM